MRKNVKTEDRGESPERTEAAKPKRGRKPRAAKPEGNPSPEEKPEEPESGENPDTPAEPGENPEEPGQEESPEGQPEDIPEKAEEPEAGENPEEPGQEESPEGQPEDIPEKAEEAPEMPPAPVMPTQVIESPLKRMRQEFTERAQVIREQMRNIQNAFITIGFQLHWIRENNMFRVLNYKNVYEYAEMEYGIKKTTCCNFISIVENYADRDEGGNVIESIADCYRNYSASQLVAMLGMDDETRQQVTPDMSVRAINKLRKGETETPAVEMETPAERLSPAKEDAPEPEDAAGDVPAAEEQAGPEEKGEPVDVTGGPVEEPAGQDGGIREEAGEDAGEDRHMEEVPENGAGDMEEEPEGSIPDGTLAEIDSYSDYQGMAEELDLLMRSVFAGDASVRVRIVCVQG